MPEMSIDNGERADYEELEHVSTGGYDWDDCALLRHKESGQLYFASDSGCSCFYWWEGSVHAEPVATWQEWAERAQRWAGGAAVDDSDYAKNMVMEAIERLNQTRPERSPKGAANA